MSNLTVCRECNTPNTPGSKFCNNCGARLPAGTNLICSNCGTPNPRNRVFCDNCGTRLVKEETPKVPDKPEEPASGGTKAFSLPARPPGDTGELDPNTLPDWLKTGDTGAIDAGHTADDQSDEMPDWLKASLRSKGADPDKLPRLEELTPDKRTTDDLPDWLVSEGDTSPIIDSPKEISTEIYLDLVSRAEDNSDPDEPFDASQANLPDWLAEAASLPDIAPEAGNQRLGNQRLHDDTDDSAAFDSPAEPGPADDLRSPAESASETSESEVVESAVSSDLTGRPSEPDLYPDTEASAEDASEAELADWLADLDQLGEVGDVDGGQEEADADTLFEETAAASTMPAAPDAADADTAETDFDELLPDWLADSAAEGDAPVAADETDDAFDDLFVAAPTTPESELAWLAATDGLTLEDEESDDRPGAEPGETEGVVGEPSRLDDEATAEPDQPAPTNDLDWLTELAAFERDVLTAGQTATEDEQLEEERPEDIPTTDALSEPAPTTASATPADLADDDWLSPNSLADDDLLTMQPEVAEELPDWLEQLGPPISDQSLDSGVEAELGEEPLLPSEDLPDWIASMRPNSSLLGSSLPSALSPASSLPEPLQDIPEELAGAELPEWLQDIPISEAPVTPAEEVSGIPDWLIDLPEGYETSDISVDQEWDNILGDLPPAVPLEQTLVKADIPDWVQALKPPDLLRERSVAEGPAEPAQTAPDSGPLAGLQGAVAIEPVILKPRMVTAFDQFTLPPTLEQQQQVTLLRQLTRNEPGLATTVMPKTVGGVLPSTTSLWLRLLLAGILIATILLGLLVPDLVMDEPVSTSDSVEQVYTIIEAAAGRPVLVAFEYTPALAGELTPQANLLLAQLDANGSTVITVSQYPAGMAIAAASSQDVSHQDLGYLAGEAIGLRQLGNCLSHQLSCETVPGWIQRIEIQQTLSDVALIIVLTGERNTLINWIEQVGTRSEVPIVAGITQALAPVAAPYVATGQLEGVLEGATATTVYEEGFGLDLPGSGRRPLAAQQMAQLVVAAFLLIGSLLYGISGTIAKQSAQQTRP